MQMFQADRDRYDHENPHTRADIYDLRDDKHAWAFYYYCKRLGDDIKCLKQRNGRVVFRLRRVKEEKER